MRKKGFTLIEFVDGHSKAIPWDDFFRSRNPADGDVYNQCADLWNHPR